LIHNVNGDESKKAKIIKKGDITQHHIDILGDVMEGNITFL